MGISVLYRTLPRYYVLMRPKNAWLIDAYRIEARELLITIYLTEDYTTAVA